MTIDRDDPAVCLHEHVQTFRSVPPHSKCLDCGAVVRRVWVAVEAGEE